MDAELTEARLFERWTADILLAEDPVSVLADAQRDPELSESSRQALGQMNLRGLRVSALLVARLRFERLMQGSREAAAWFERSPAEFTAAFRTYHHDVPPAAMFPWEEAAQFTAWRTP